MPNLSFDMRQALAISARLGFAKLSIDGHDRSAPRLSLALSLKQEITVIVVRFSPCSAGLKWQNQPDRTLKGAKHQKSGKPGNSSDDSGP